MGVSNENTVSVTTSGVGLIVGFRTGTKSEGTSSEGLFVGRYVGLSVGFEDENVVEIDGEVLGAALSAEGDGVVVELIV